MSERLDGLIAQAFHTTCLVCRRKRLCGKADYEKCHAEVAAKVTNKYEAAKERVRERMRTR